MRIELTALAWKARVLPLYDGRTLKTLVVGVGFEPTKAMPADLQSVPFSHLDTPPIPLILLMKAI